MIVSEETISEEELHAYIDNQLDEQLRLAVEHYLAEHPQEADDVRYHQQLNQSLREAYSSQLQEPVPRQLRLTAGRAAPGPATAGALPVRSIFMAGQSLLVSPPCEAPRAMSGHREP